RDGGVRCKIINVSDRSKWDLVELPNVTEAQIRFYFEITKGKKYDLWGALVVVLGFKQRGERFFCSEWCFNAIFNSEQGWRFSPNQLAVILNKEMLR
ncbi:enoyl-CoA hydratase, partial [Glaesserella parasuis]|nr:enoyl-CoA hydratase [Glaesserella parasuis]MCT8660091.1 enoyl-CoA hydratase [Glaesserella parasuis]MCT8666277.1 enoyl-CoA hydratase [Glaesserella parasuis]MCT8668341.1 enoyl-CoA hydratase [Glaesserella parasuis]MCT8672492.1 enoyl-CoA hydratase [Glaesserella parasuis]